MADHDIDNFSSSPHRLPTISASQALQDIGSSPRRSISTGLPTLDRLLQDPPVADPAQDDFVGGLPCGQVTEVYGPPGAGKTIFSMNVACNALLAGASVVWIDTSYMLDIRRLRDSLAHSPKQDGHSIGPSEDSLNRFNHFMAPTLSHLLALLVHSNPSFPPKETGLLVVDALSTSFNNAFAQAQGRDAKASVKNNDVAQWAASRRWAVMADLISALVKLARTKSMAVILSSHTMTRIMHEGAASLQPAISGTAWEAGIHCRMLFFQDWQVRAGDQSSQQQGEMASDLRFVAVTKINGNSLQGFGEVVPFTIDKYGLCEVKNVLSTLTSLREPMDPLQTNMKRKRDEIADSASESGDLVSDDEFGWVED